MKANHLNIRERRSVLARDTASITFKSLTLLGYFGAMLWVLLEVKQHYHIDVLPGIDSPVDDLYGYIRSSITQLF